MARPKAKRSISKFDDRLTELVYSLSLDGGPDEEVGSSSEAPGTWAGLMRGGRQMAQALETDSEHGLDRSDPEDDDVAKELAEAAGVVLFEDTQGFVTSELYTDGNALEHRWKLVSEELGDGDNDEEYDEGEDDEDDGDTDVPDEGYLGNGQIDFRSIRAGMRVTIRTPQKQERTGRAVMLGPSGWVLNMGGAHGTPGIATERNFVRASGRGSGSGERLGGMRSNHVFREDFAALGARAFKRGLPRRVVMDEAFIDAVGGDPDGNLRDPRARKGAEEWYRGWDRANINKPVHSANARRVTIAEITHAEIRYYADNEQETAYVTWIGSDGKQGRTEGPPDNSHIKALLARARREGVPVREETWGMRSNAKLITSTDSSRAKRLVREAAEDKFGADEVQDVFYEHGQWWITLQDGQNWSAVDARPGISHGIDFEEI